MPDSTPAWPGVRLHVVTGKGGTGKTTVAAALALTLAGDGRRVLLAEVEGRQGISQVLDVAPLSDREQRVLRVGGGGEVWGLAVDAKAALLEYLDTFYRMGRAGTVLEKLGAIDFATTIAPGVRDVLLIGKVYEAVRRRVDTPRETPAGPTSWAYDAVVLDAPPTGRMGHFLGVNDEVADLAKVGPIRNQADSITRLLRSDTTAVHLTTVLEDMPVQECLDAVDELAHIQVPLGAIIVNQARDELVGEGTRALLTQAMGPGPGPAAAFPRDGITAALSEAHLDSSPATVQALVAGAADHAARLDLEDRLLAEIAGAGAPMILLPRLADTEDPGSVRILAQDLADQAVWA